MDGFCSRMKKERKVRAAVLVTTKYEQTMFQGRGKTMHRSRRNDRLIFFMSQKKRELLYDEMDFGSN
jgi:hypothetical protein